MDARGLARLCALDPRLEREAEKLRKEREAEKLRKERAAERQRKEHEAEKQRKEREEEERKEREEEKRKEREEEEKRKEREEEEKRNERAEWSDSADTGRMYSLIFDGNVRALEEWISSAPSVVHVRSADGRGPLWWAFERSRMDIVDVLIQHGADEAATDTYGETPDQLLTCSSKSKKKWTRSQKYTRPYHLASLKLPPVSTWNQVRRTYLRLALKCHPDKNRHETATAIFQEMNIAYEFFKIRHTKGTFP